MVRTILPGLRIPVKILTEGREWGVRERRLEEKKFFEMILIILLSENCYHMQLYLLRYELLLQNIRNFMITDGL